MENNVKILYVDDEKESLDNFYLLFKRDYLVLTANSANDALDILKKEPDVGIVISDQRMPKMKGTTFLEKIAHIYPDTMRIILTAYMDVKAAVAAINRGEVFRYVMKPYDAENLRSILEEAGNIYLTKRRNAKLLKEFEEESISLKDLNNELSSLVTAHSETLEDLEQQEEFYRLTVESANDAIIITDKMGKIVLWNDLATVLFGYNARQATGKTLSLIFPQGDKISNIDKLADIASRKTPLKGAETLELVGQRKGKIIFPVEVTRSLFRTHNGSMFNVHILRNISNRKKVEDQLRKEVSVFSIAAHNTEEINNALNVLLGRRERENAELEDRMNTIVKMLVIPYIEKLNKSNLNSTQQAYTNIIETNLKELMTPVGKSSNTKYLDMTPKEMKIAGYIKEGKKNKEIAQLMGVSINTILFHRYNIRKKLGLLNAKKNLRSYLTTVPV